MKRPTPPRLAERLLGRFILPELLEEITGDLYEYYDELSAFSSWKRAVFYWFHVSQFLRPSLIKPLFNTQKINYLAMLNFSFKTALRNFVKHPSITYSSLLTLVLGAICFQLINAWIYNEWEMNAFHSKLDRIHITAAKTNPTANLTPLGINTLFDVDYGQFPEIEQSVHIHVYGKDEIKLISNSHEYKGKAFVVDSTFFDIFDFPLAIGNSQTLLKNPTDIVITQSFAKRLFENKDPVGQFVQLRGDNQGTYQIAGILEAIPSNSSLSFDFLVPRHSQSFWRRMPQEFVLTKPNLNLTAFNEKIKDAGRYGNQKDRFPESEMYLISFKESYFNHPFESSLFDRMGNKDEVYTFLFIAIMLLLITLFGFNNLQSTLQISLSKKVGIKHIIGGSKGALSLELAINQLLFFLLAILISFCIYEASFSTAASFLEIPLDQKPLYDLVGLAGFLLFITLISIAIGVIRTSRISAHSVLNDASGLFTIPTRLRILSTFQYVITTVLLIATATVYLQFSYMLNKDTQLPHTNVVEVDFFEIAQNASREELAKSYQFVKNELATSPIVASFSQGSMPVNRMANETSWKRADGGYEYTTENMMVADPGYGDMLGLELIEGRFFSDSLDQSNQQKVVINEAAMKYWGITDITTTDLMSNTSGRHELSFDIIGVIKDYHYEHLSKKIQPLILRYRTYQDYSFLIRFEDGRQQEGIDFLQTLFHTTNPNGTFEYEMLEDRIAAQYAEEKRLGTIYLSFTVVALILSSLCLFTFALYETQRRTKEVGIRKAIGANKLDIFRLLGTSFLTYISLGFAIALPIAWYFKESWISQFANQATIGWGIYAGSGLIILLTATIAIAYQVFQISRTNPVHSLRYE